MRDKHVDNHRTRPRGGPVKVCGEILASQLLGSMTLRRKGTVMRRCAASDARSS